MNKKYDVVIIGGGLAGLTSAAALAAAGKKVAVLEQYSVFGGSTHVFRRKGGWEWQVGVHHVANCLPNGDMPTVFRGLGLDGHIEYEQMDPTGFERYVFPDLTFETPADWDEFTNRVYETFPEERANLQRFFGAVWNVGKAVDRGPSSASVTGLLRTALRSGLHAPLALRSTTSVMEKFGLSKRAQTLLGVSPCGSLNCAPDGLPFSAFANFWVLFTTGGAWFPRGGGQVFSSHLARVVERYGGDLVTGAFVDEILVRDGRVEGVRIRGGSVYSSTCVVSTADIKKTYNHMLPVEAHNARHARRVNGYTMALPFFNAFLGASVDLAAHYPKTDFFSMPTWTPLQEVFDLMSFREGDDAERWLERVVPVLPGFIHCSNLKDPSTTRYAPAGSSSIEAMAPIRLDYRLWGAQAVERRNHDYQSQAPYRLMKETLIDVMVDRAQAVVPELAGRIVHREAATPLTQERYTQSTEGSSYGIEFNTRQVALRRADATTHIRGLYLAGASCRPGPSTEGVMLSGVYAASAILRRDLLAEFRAARPLVAAGTMERVPSGWDPLRAAKRRVIGTTVSAAKNYAAADE